MKHILSVALLLTAKLLTAQSLPDLAKSAISNYPALKAQQTLISINEQKIDLLKTGYRPTVSADASLRLQVPTIKFSIPTSATTTKDITFQPLENWSAQVSASQQIYDFGKLNANIQKSIAELQYSKDNVSAQEFTLAYNVAQLYYSIIYLNKSIAISDAQIKQLEDTKALLEVQVKNGVVLDYEVLAVQVRINNALNQQTELKGSLRKQVILLNNLVGREGDYTPATNDLLQAPSNAAIADLLGEAEKNSLDLMLLKSKINVAEQDVNIAKKADKPTLLANAAAGVRNGFQPDVHLPRPNFLIGVTFSAPIYAGGRYKLQRKVAELGVVAAKDQINVVKLNIKRDMEVALNDIRTANEKAKTFAAQVAQAQKALDLATIRYKSGVLRNIELLDAQTNFTLTQLTELQYAYQLSAATLDLKRLQGEKFW